MQIFLSHRWVYLPVFAALVAVCSVAVHPFGSPKQLQSPQPSIKDAELPAEITALVKRSCMDCHSSQTAWPWYSYVAPVSWLVERDVDRGRDHLNFSSWQQYTDHQRRKLLADIASSVKNGEMPLPQYSLIHRKARLSEADRDLVYQWARGERRRLTAESQALAPDDAPMHGRLQPAGAHPHKH